MIVFVLRRIVQSIPVILLSTVTVFLLMHLVPGDPAVALAGSDATAEVVDVIRERMGLDRPLPVQYAIWLGNVLRGDLGHSYINRLPVSTLIAQRLPATIELAVAGLLLAIAVAVPTGIVSAVRSGHLIDWVISSLNAIAIALPNFWFGILMILLFGLQLRWLPPGGRGDYERDPAMALTFLVLPAVTLALNQTAILSRFMKSSMLDVLHEDYIRTARSKGLREGAIVVRHVLRNALIPVITVLGIQFGRLLGGAIIVESVFAWPGVGRLLVQAISARDYTVVQGILLLLVVTFLFVNLITDIAYGFLDPRIRLSEKRQL